jgi:hypothetical protein
LIAIETLPVRACSSFLLVEPQDDRGPLDVAYERIAAPVQCP